MLRHRLWITSDSRICENTHTDEGRHIQYPRSNDKGIAKYPLKFILAGKRDSTTYRASNMDGVERQYDYRPKATTIVLGAAFFSFCALILCIKAANNDRGLVVKRIVELGPDGATAFYWFLAACSGGFVALAALLAIQRLSIRQRLAFGSTAFSAPASLWSRENMEIAYRDVLALSVTTIGGQRFLYVTHRGGKSVVNASMLPSKAAFAEVCELLAAKTDEARTAGRRFTEPDRPGPLRDP
ncbi:MAG: hypothetical protein ACRC1K_11820 [Planctomycetia bacterium]